MHVPSADAGTAAHRSPAAAWRSVAVVVALAAFALGLILAHDRRSPSMPMIHPRNDFSTFYCAGTVARSGGNPYRVEPIRTCERAVGENDGQPAWYVVPAPFPGYALALFAALSLLPPYTAHLLWLFGLLVAVGATAWALGRITGFSPLLIGVAIATPLGYYDVGFSEPTPFFAALVAVAAERAQRGAWRTCGILCGLAMLEPHLGLPVFFALLLFAPRARAALLVTAGALAVISVAFIGVHENIEYFTAALPAQAASEIHSRAQFSLTHLLAAFGTSPHVALLLGSLSALLAAGAGVWAGRRLAVRESLPAALVLVPVAVGMIGGTYLHENHVFTAVSAAVLVARVRSLPRALAVAPLALFSVVWVAEGTWKGFLIATAVSAVAGFILVARALDGSRAERARIVAAYAVACVVAFAGLQLLPHRAAGGPLRAPAPPVAADTQASTVWAYREAQTPNSLPDPSFEAAKLPYVLALFLIAGCAFAARLRPGMPLGTAQPTAPDRD